MKKCITGGEYRRAEIDVGRFLYAPIAIKVRLSGTHMREHPHRISAAPTRRAQVRCAELAKRRPPSFAGLQCADTQTTKAPIRPREFCFWQPNVSPRVLYSDLIIGAPKTDARQIKGSKSAGAPAWVASTSALYHRSWAAVCPKIQIGRI